MMGGGQMLKHIPRMILLFVVAFLLVACGTNENATNGGVAKPDEQMDENGGNKEDEYDDLIAKFVQPGDIPVPEDNPMSEEKVELGKMLFYDPRLSGDNDRSCATCHAPALGWGDGRSLFQTIDGEDGPRHSPTIINAAYFKSLFWDGRADSLKEQVLGPISSPIEMNQNLDDLAEELKAVDGYPELFEEAFGEDITIENIAKAIAAFERTIVMNDTRFNEFLDGDYDAMTEQEIHGMELFAGKARCISCHNGPAFSDHLFHNVGIESDDEGRKEVTGLNADDGAFRTPGLYGIAHHPPYMHDGSLETLEEVIDFYDRGGDDHPNKSPIIHELNLSDEEKEALLAFLHVLSGDESPQADVPDIP